MKHGSLFSGIGGFDLAAEWMGWENVFHCEWNEFGQKVLKYYWPNALSYADITKTDFAIHAGKIDILTGGFPCQPYSSAGKRLGKEDDRHLWPEMLRAIREIQPTWVLGENVRGLTNWNGGLVLDEVQADLESQGYEVTPFLLPAVAVNAPHRRDRIWFVAYSASYGSSRASGETSGQAGRQDRHEAEQSIKRGEIQSSTDSSYKGLQGGEDIGGITGGREIRNEQFAGLLQSAWKNFPTQSPVCTGDDGIPTGLDGITFSKWRNESIKSGGNAIVPQVAFQIFKAIEQYDHLRNT